MIPIEEEMKGKVAVITGANTLASASAAPRCSARRA